MRQSLILKALDGARCCLNGTRCYACPYCDHIEAAAECKKKLMTDIYKSMANLEKQ